MSVRLPHHGCCAEKLRKGHIQVSPAEVGKAVVGLAEQLSGKLFIVRLAAGQSGQNVAGTPQAFGLHLLLDALQSSGHFADADRFEQVIVYAGLNGSLGVFELTIAADNDDVNVRLESPGLLGQLNAIHSVHADVRQQKVHGVLLQKLQRQFSAGGSTKDVEAVGKLLNDRADKSERRNFIIHDENTIHFRHAPFDSFTFPN